MIKRLAQPEPAPPWSFPAAVASLVAMFAAMVIGSTIAQTLLPDSPSVLITGWSIGAALTVIFVMAAYHRRSLAHADALRLGPTRARLSLVMLFALGMAITFDLLSQIVTGEFALAASQLMRFIAGAEIGFFGWVIAFMFMVGLQPAAEEMVLRGMLFPALRAALGAWTGFVICAAFHAAFHFITYPPPPGDQTVLLWYGLGLPFLIALVVTGVRAYTGSTRAAIAAHAAFGLFAVLKLLILVG
jgi:membrane protease YdiL (CAAX protease family)